MCNSFSHVVPTHRRTVLFILICSSFSLFTPYASCLFLWLRWDKDHSVSLHLWWSQRRPVALCSAPLLQQGKKLKLKPARWRRPLRPVLSPFHRMEKNSLDAGKKNVALPFKSAAHTEAAMNVWMVFFFQSTWPWRLIFISKLWLVTFTLPGFTA